MGKRMLNLLAIGITLFSYKLYGQTQINFPVNGAVFQQNSSGQHTIRLGGQVKHNDNKWYIRIRKRSGDDSWDDINIEQREISLSSVGDGTNTRYFFITGNTAGGPLIRDKGFYKATLFRKGFLGKKHFYGNVEFGIGDVYYVAGQSNAAGYGGQGNNGFAGDDANLTWEAEVKFMDDNAISTTGNTGVVSPMTRVLSTRIDENNAFPGESLGNQQPISIGTVYKQFEYRNVSTLPGFSEFKNGATDNNPNSKYTDQNRVPIYPNGYNSWCWAPLGYLFATDGTGNASQKYNGTPTLWFNAASAGSAMVDLVGGPGYNYNAWSRNPGSENSVYAKLGNTLRNFGSVYGAKAVLWTQGETDAARLWLNEASNDNYILDNYTTQLNNIIGYSREAATGLTNHSSEAFKSLNWFLSKTSLFPTPDGSVGGNGTTHLSSATINGSIPGFVSDPIKARQIINTSNKVFEGPNTDNHLTRATGAKIHFTGSTLQNLANEWYTKIAFVNSSASVEPAEPLGFSSISKMGNNYTLTVNNSISGTHFFWQKNNDANMRYPHIGSPLSNETTSNISHPILASAGDVLHCYVFKNGRFHPVAPYVVPGDSEPLKILNADKSSLNFLPSGGSHQVRVIYENVSWQVDSKPSWLSESYN